MHALPLVHLQVRDTWLIWCYEARVRVSQTTCRSGHSAVIPDFPHLGSWQQSRNGTRMTLPLEVRPTHCTSTPPPAHFQKHQQYPFPPMMLASHLDQMDST